MSQILTIPSPIPSPTSRIVSPPLAIQSFPLAGESPPLVVAPLCKWRHALFANFDQIFGQIDSIPEPLDTIGEGNVSLLLPGDTLRAPKG